MLVARGKRAAVICNSQHCCNIRSKKVSWVWSVYFTWQSKHTLSLGHGLKRWRRKLKTSLPKCRQNDGANTEVLVHFLHLSVRQRSLATIRAGIFFFLPKERKLEAFTLPLTTKVSSSSSSSWAIAAELSPFGEPQAAKHHGARRFIISYFPTPSRSHPPHLWLMHPAEPSSVSAYPESTCASIGTPPHKFRVSKQCSY